MYSVYRLQIAIVLSALLTSCVPGTTGQPVEVTRIVVVTATPEALPNTPEAKVVLLPTPTPTPAEPVRVIDPVVALSKMSEDIDSISGKTEYVAETIFQNIHAGDDLIFALVIQKEEDKLSLWLQIYFSGDDWIFIENYTVRAGENAYSVIPPVKPRREVGTAGFVQEWSLLPVGDNEIEIIQSILNSDYAIVRASGQRGNHDSFMTVEDKQGLRDTLDAYQALGGRSVVTKDAWPAQPVELLRAQIVGDWKRLEGGNIWTFAPDGSLSHDDSGGGYTIPDSGRIKYNFGDHWPFERRIEIHGDQMFFVDDDSDTFNQYQRTE